MDRVTMPWMCLDHPSLNKRAHTKRMSDKADRPFICSVRATIMTPIWLDRVSLYLIRSQAFSAREVGLVSLYPYLTIHLKCAVGIRISQFI
jgi:hypothetical protein